MLSISTFFSPSCWLPWLLAGALLLPRTGRAQTLPPAVRAANLELVGAPGVDRVRVSWDGAAPRPEGPATQGAVLVIQDADLSNMDPVAVDGAPLTGSLSYAAPADSLGPRQYVLAAGFGARRAAVVGLAPGHRYRLDVFSFNDRYEYTPADRRPSSATRYFTSAALATAGVVRDSLLSPLPLASPDCAAITVGWQGDPARQSLLVIQDVAESDFVPLPVDGTFYRPTPFFGAGQVIAAGQYVVASALGKASPLRGLQPGHRYRLDVIAYSDEYEYAASYYSSTRAATCYFTFPSCPLLPNPARTAEWQLTAFPNPGDALSQDRVSVQLSGPPVAIVATVLLTVRTLMGQQILERTMPLRELMETSFSTRGWAPGVYLLDARVPDGQHCRSRFLVR